jgi:uncharacterized protein YndB with AHSA1/START domain
MTGTLIAKASTKIDAPPAKVWDALVKPELIQKYMFGATVVSDWKVGSPIVWKGEWQGKKYEDKGVILEMQPQKRLRYSHFSPLSGLPEKPENFHHVTIELAPDGRQTAVQLSQDNNPTDEGRKHSEENWKKMLAGLKDVAES